MDQNQLANLGRVVKRGRELQDQIENCEKILKKLDERNNSIPLRYEVVGTGGYGNRTFKVKIGDYKLISAIIQTQLDLLKKDLDQLSSDTQIAPPEQKNLPSKKKSPSYDEEDVEEDEEYEGHYEDEK